MENLNNKSSQSIVDISLNLWELIPSRTLSHYANQQGKGEFDICYEMVVNHGAWVDRVFNERLWSLEDLMHDVVGILSKEENLITRI
jgi:hypothetical protein|tara:strand:+ start:4594 stop:4854 length:261 start_codon:yes stop_codon:yes gene_type:complete